nr:VPLPA-CTERM sorting domain-containing protein [Desulfobacterales bacterium]
MDIDQSDKNKIISQRNIGSSGLIVRERLAEPGEVPLATVPKLAKKSHYAPIKNSATLTVNKKGEFFDSFVTTSFCPPDDGSLTIDWTFEVKSKLDKDPGIVGYGFEFYDTDFNGIDENINITFAESDVFTDWEFGDGLLDFYDPTFENCVDYNELVTFNFTMEISGLGEEQWCKQFGMRQYDIVPVPGAVWLLGSAMLAIVGIRRRK